MADRKILACVRVQNMPEPSVPSTERRCVGCGLPVWLSNATPRVDAEIHCLECLQDALESARDSGEEVVLQPPTEEQLAEIRRSRN